MYLGSAFSLAVMALVVWTPLLSVAPVLKPSPEQARKELDTLWAHMLSADELVAGRAMLKLGARPDDAVIYLKEKLSPLKLSEERAKQLLADLGGNDEKAVRAAYDEFTYLDPRLALGDKELREALLDRPASRQLAAVLCDLPLDAFAAGKWHWYSPDNEVLRFNLGNAIRNHDAAITVADIGKFGRKATWARAVRAIAVLEHLGTPEAVAILKDMATGHADAAPTKAAKTVMERMNKR
jgi:hypothetical protein